MIHVRFLNQLIYKKNKNLFRKSKINIESYKLNSESILNDKSDDINNSYNIIDLYEIKHIDQLKDYIDNLNLFIDDDDNNELKTNNYNIKRKQLEMLKNINNIHENKHAFHVEAQNFINKKNLSNKSKEIYHTFLNIEKTEKFLYENSSTNLFNKYNNELEGPSKIARDIKIFCDDVIDRIDPNLKFVM